MRRFFSGMLLLAFISAFVSGISVSADEGAGSELGKIVISDAVSGIVYDRLSDAQGKEATVTVPVSFAGQTGKANLIIAIYNGNNKLLYTASKAVSVSETEVTFNVNIPKASEKVKIMCWDSIEGMTPLCESVWERDVNLDGKKIIFIGNSHVYRGLTVTEKGNSVLTQAARTGDTGYFYQLCKANGYDVEVTNWTFPSHGTYHLFNTECPVSGSCKGKKHEEYLVDKYFDYVFINSATTTTNAGAFVDNVNYLIKLFRDVNPDVKIILLGNASSWGVNKNSTPYTGVTDAYESIAAKGIVIADWGRVVKGILDGEYEVPGAKYDYKKSSFVVSDNYHPNALAGYLTTLTAYCAITGEPAVGQPYDFYNDTTLNSKFDMNAYLNKYYTNGASDTNSDEIFASESDMRGLQQLVDDLLKN